MKQKPYFLNVVLAVLLGLILAVAVLLRSFSPALILPELNIPNMALISLLALLIDHYFAPGSKRCYFCIPIFGALCFGLLPFAAGFATAAQLWKLALVGGILFTLLTWLFSSILDRISTGPEARLAPVISAFGLYLAFQALTGILL